LTDAALGHPVAPFLVRTPFSAARLNQLAGEFERTGFCQTDPVPTVLGLEEYGAQVFQMTCRHGERVATHHRVEDGRLTGGARFCRLDPGHPGLDHRTRLSISEAYADLEADPFFRGLRRALRELTERILPFYGYERGYFLAYRAGDYLSAHDDRSTGDRVNVQMPVTVGGTGALRILSDEGFLEPRLDRLGAVRVIGPSIWHDVPPLLTASDGFRVVFSLRFRKRVRS